MELPERFRRNSALAQPQWPVNVLSATRARDDVLADVGASAGLFCRGGWVRRSDAVDQRVVNSVALGTGPSAPPKNESDAGGFPSLDGGSPCSDTDGDGMPDEFEQRYGLNPDIPGDAMLDADRDGYSNIEEFVNATHP